MNRITRAIGLLAVVTLGACDAADVPTTPDLTVRPDFARSSQARIGINVLLDRPATDAIRTELVGFGSLRGEIVELQAVLLSAPGESLEAIRALPYVVAANPDAERGAGPPMPPLPVSNFENGLNTWNLDAIDVTDRGLGRTIGAAADGAGVYIGVLDTGLLDSWMAYFPVDRIAVAYARSFGGGGASGNGNVSTQPNKWEHDTQSHGSHVTSTIIGYNLGGTPINGVAPQATIIPVKVLNNNGSGWSSTIAEGIVYIADLKAGPLAGSPVIINMSLGGSVLDAVEQAAIDYAIARGVIIVASAGNRGTAGMGYPGGYAPVISVGAVGWAGEWFGGTAWWVAGNIAEPTNPNHFYVTDFSSRRLAGQDLDVLAPGSWVVGPWQTNRGQTSYFFVGGTSMASPHVAGLVALMAQKDPGLTAAEAEAILQATAIPLAPGTRSVLAGPGGPARSFAWGADATGSGIVSAPAALAATGS